VPATLVEIRRYPVKSMGGEALDQVEIDARGLVGDRQYAVVDGDGRFAAGKDSRRFRRRDHVFEYVASTGPDTGSNTGPGTRTGSAVRIARADGHWTAGDASLDDELSERFGDPVRVLPEGQISHFDASPVSIVGTATLDWCARELGVDADRRRLRTNLILETAEPFEEEGWIGRTVEIGTVSLAVTERVERCRTIDLAQDGVATTTSWLKALGRSRELCVAVYADVAAPGQVTVGDLVRLR
jgi:uncharacterized protein YcbX